MLVNCKACEKKFLVPNAAITESGRLLQCGSCGNKWTQYPIIQESKKETKKIIETNMRQPASLNKVKKLVKKKKREINLYSEEYLKKKHGLTIDGSNLQKKIKKNKEVRNNFSFYNYLVTISIFIIALFGVINLSKDAITTNYPGAAPYINSLYEVLDNAKIIISEIINFF